MSTTKTEPAVTVLKNGAKPYGKIVLTLKNCLLPEEKLLLTPSQNDGLDRDTEIDLRIYGCELIQTAGILLKLPQVAMATGQVLLQRFYYSKSLVRHPIEHTAMACVCLASKIEEAPRRVRDVINVFHHVRQVDSKKTLQPMILDQHYITLKTQVIKAERRVLKELGFCVHIKHPHKIIVMYLQVLSYEKNLALMQLAWNYMNDSLRTDAFVRYQPEVIACACIYLTARKLKLPLPRAPAWYLVFGVSELQIKDVCLKILRLYARPKPNVEALEKKVDELCKQYHDAKIKARTGSENNTPHSGSPSSPGQKISGGTHNAWGGFISRSGSHIVPTNDKQPPRSRSRSGSHSPVANKHHKRSKKHNRSRSRSPARPHKKSHKRRPSYSRSRSASPHAKQSRKTGRDKNRHRSRSRSVSYDKDAKSDKFHDRNDRYAAEKNTDKYIKDDKYSRDDRDKDRYKKSKQERSERSKDRRR
ncbi:uncharacterized protein CBL_12875 [Carabus blaptoides fortunei]